MRLRSPLVGLVVAALVVLSVVAPAGLAHAAGPRASAASPSPSLDADGEAQDLGDGGALAQSGVETDNVRLVVTLAEDGSARWEVQYWTRLDGDNVTEAFEALQRDIRRNPGNYGAQFAERMRTTVTSAENATGREMAVENVSVASETRGPPQYGVVIYSFRWTGFAAADGDTIRVGDAIEGIFLSSDTRLILQWPGDYGATSVTPAADERRSDAVVWRGSETEFVAGEPAVVLRRGTTGTAGAGGGGAGGSPSGGGLGSPLSLALGVVAFGVLGALAWRFWRDRDPGPGTGPGPGAGANADAGASAPRGGTGADAADAPGGSADLDPDPDPDPRPELLSNEERVLKFVRDRGGRVKQQEVVREFDWTEARTSQIVRQLRDDGELEGFRLGRENVLKLPDDGDGAADDAGSGSGASGEGGA